MPPLEDNQNLGRPLPAKKPKVVQPLHDNIAHEGNEAVDMIRGKLSRIYADEPSAKEEAAEAEAIKRNRSKHQQFMHELSGSGRSLAEIQTAWHNYYVNLPNNEKHEVWQEFYSNHSRITTQSKAHTHATTHSPPALEGAKEPQTHQNDPRSEADIKNQIIRKVNRRATTKQQAHRKSLRFGLTMGLLVSFIMLFGFFNERFVAPFITPSRAASATPIIIDGNSPVGPEPRIIIPKINLEIPAVYDEPSVDEAAVQRALESGILHYGITPNPGEKGNATFFGHSSNNILNRGKFKFAFVLLNRMEVGDTFMIHKDGVRYVYRVFEKRVVKPNDTSVLADRTDKVATATLITCDPPGTSLNRLIVVGEQITPDPSGNATGTSTASEQPAVLPSNAPSLWNRIVDWLSR